MMKTTNLIEASEGIKRNFYVLNLLLSCAMRVLLKKIKNLGRSSMLVINRLFQQSLFLVMISFLGCSHGPEPERQRTDLHLKLGNQFLNAGNYPAAFRELSRALELNPTDPVVHNLLGLTYSARGRLRQSESYFKKAIELDKAYSDARNNLSHLYIRMKRYPEAIEQLKQVIKDLKYQSPEKGYFSLGLVYYRMSRLNLAEKHFLQATQLNDRYCQAHNFYGKTLLRQRNFKKASYVFDKAIVVCDDFDEAFYYSALSYLYAGAKKRARSQFRKFLTIYPESKYRHKSQKHLKNLMTKNTSRNSLKL